MRGTLMTALAVLAISGLSRDLSRVSAQTAGEEICRSCEALSGLRIDDTNVLSAVVVPARDEVPEHCRILGYVRPAINFEVVLPINDWNGKYLMRGCGGFCGNLGSNQDGLGRRYAASTMDSGHWGEWVFDGRWAYHNRVAEVDWGHRAVHETARVAKTLIEAFYDPVLFTPG